MNTRTAQILIFAFVFMCNVAFAAPAAASVTLHGDTEVNRSTVKLSDVFDGLPADTDCDIARAPAPGKSITYDSNVLAHLKHQYKLDWTPESASDHITITTASTKITADDIRAAVIEKAKALNIVGEIDVMFDNPTLEIVLPADRPANFTLNNFNFEGINKRFKTELVADGFAGPVTMPVMGHIVVRHSVPVLVRRLETGTIISEGDVTWADVTDDHLSGVATTAEALINHELKHDTDAGQPVHEHDVMQPRYVVRGNLVTMKIETPLMTVTAQGRALQDGKLGDTVRVLNTTSNRMVEGSVESDGVVRIHMARIVAAADTDAKQE
jgi:flagella basal body P-ring formation protein FlgA